MAAGDVPEAPDHAGIPESVAGQREQGLAVDERPEAERDQAADMKVGHRVADDTVLLGPHQRAGHPGDGELAFLRQPGEFRRGGRAARGQVDGHAGRVDGREVAAVGPVALAAGREVERPVPGADEQHVAQGRYFGPDGRELAPDLVVGGDENVRPGGAQDPRDMVEFQERIDRRCDAAAFGGVGTDQPFGDHRQHDRYGRRLRRREVREHVCAAGDRGDEVAIAEDARRNRRVGRIRAPSSRACPDAGRLPRRGSRGSSSQAADPRAGDFSITGTSACERRRARARRPGRGAQPGSHGPLDGMSAVRVELVSA